VSSQASLLGGSGPLFIVARHLTDRLAQLEERLQGADDGVWTSYVETAHTLALLLPQLPPERQGALLTTKEMATRLGLSPKTLLKHRKTGAIRLPVQRGKFIRWRGDEAIR
jgi:helix-turn-helix protein